MFIKLQLLKSTTIIKKLFIELNSKNNYKLNNYK